jgi:ATP-dependent DNA helicase RecG
MKPEFNQDTPVQFLKSVGPARARALSRLGIETVGDLLCHYPRRYFDRSSAVPIRGLKSGQDATVQGEILTASERRTRRGGSVLTVTVGDDTGVLFCVWFNQKFLLKQFKSGRKMMVSGVIQMHGGRAQMAHPDFEVFETGGQDDESSPGLNTGRMVPVYGLTSGVGQYWLRGLVHQGLTKMQDLHIDPLPDYLRAAHGFPDRRAALENIHFPPDRQGQEIARDRLVYEELFTIQILMALRRESRRGQPGVTLNKPGDLTTRLVGDLPFSLTGAQRRVLKEILADMRSGQSMHRLLQGDVGSGKTLVALIAALFVIEQGYQALIMAPTEVLARQHGKTLSGLCEPLGIGVETLTGSTSAAVRRGILAGVAAGEIDLLVGTHAVIQQDVRIPRLALAVVDEQHRFGVRQRGRPSSETGEPIHVLVMSATPIPRSLALTLYGDLDLSLIDELPAGRQPITTSIVREKDEDSAWEACRRELKAGRQAYIIYPVIEETEGMDLKAATVEFERLRDDVFSGHKVALLHGRMKGKEKDAIMAAFSEGETQVLVATTVVEVGIDVPNATAMIIHNPERFGLAQLHQLRGRIGRGRYRSRCWLLCDRYLAEESYARIRFFSENTDGFALAEEDLRLRGPGDAWGTRQHGAPGFRLANPLRDVKLVRACRDDARELLERDPDLTGPEGRIVRLGIKTTFGNFMPLQAV